MLTRYITFPDGNVIVSTATHDFRVHRGLLCISSTVWQKTFEAGPPYVREEDVPKVEVPLSAAEVDSYMCALYGM